MNASVQAASRTGRAVASVPLLIDGTFVESTTITWKDVVNPATQETGQGHAGRFQRSSKTFQRKRVPAT
jgi:hypothetical protein